MFLVLMVHLIKAFQLSHFKALIELLGCSRPLTFDCSPHQRQTNHSKPSPALLLQHSAGMWSTVDKSFTTISSGLLGCHLILAGYTMLQTMAISICRQWESCLSDICEFKKNKKGKKGRKENKRSREVNVGSELQPSPRQVLHLCASLLLSLLIWTICQVFSIPVLEAGFVCATMMPYNGECCAHIQKIQKDPDKTLETVWSSVLESLFSLILSLLSGVVLWGI